ncbi:MAG TPA: hypothetical protein PLZ05_03055 [Alphaproteobacteria bacterium]|nr:hypothetical protein [Alphaproteobacteria bacterium]
MNIILNRQGTGKPGKFRCYCAKSCIALNEEKQNKRKLKFLTEKNFGGIMPIFCPFFEKTIFRYISDERPDPKNKITVFNKNTGKYSWANEETYIYRQATKESMLHGIDSLVPDFKMQEKNR